MLSEWERDLLDRRNRMVRERKEALTTLLGRVRAFRDSVRGMTGIAKTYKGLMEAAEKWIALEDEEKTIQEKLREGRNAEYRKRKRDYEKACNEAKVAIKKCGDDGRALARFMGRR